MQMRNNVRNLRGNIHPLLVHYVNNKYIKFKIPVYCSCGEGSGTHSSILAWKMLWTVEPGSLQSKGHRESDMTKQCSTGCS